MDYNRINWISENLRIIDKHGSLVPLEINEGQVLLHQAMEVQRSKGLPVRIDLLKPRQVGWTTWSEAEGFYDVWSRENINAMTVSVDTDSTDNVFGMVKRFQEELPLDLSRRVDNTNRKELKFSRPHRSRFLAQTAGKMGVGRSFQCRFLHCSEVAFWSNALEQLAGLYQMVPEEDGTTIIKETTANGVGGAFYDSYWEATERQKRGDLRGFQPVFFPWYKFSEYKTDIPDWFSLTPDEKTLKEIFSLSDEQVYWRRVKIEQLNGDESLFKQEYPSTALEAFQASGNPIFTQKMIASQEAYSKGKPRYAMFTGPHNLMDADWRDNAWQIKFLPEDGHQYTMGIDSHEGKVSDTSDSKSKLDKHGVGIFDRTDQRFVAIYSGRGPQVELGRQCLYAAQFYNNAWVAPEIPQGMQVLQVLRDAGYEYVYNRQVHDEQLVVEDSENLGWRTTPASRPLLIENFLSEMRNATVKVMFTDVVEEMKTFVRDKMGKAVHMQGKHDDLLFACMIALQVHLRCPLNPVVYEDDHTGGWEDRVTEVDLVRIGAVDPGIGEEGTG